MKQLIRAFVIYVLFMGLMLYALVYLNNNTHYNGRDIVYYNDQLRKIEKDYLDGVSEELLEQNYKCELVFSKELVDEEMTELYANSAFVLDFAPNGNYIGKVAWTPELESFESIKSKFFGLSIYMWVLVLIGTCFFAYYLYSSLVKPINELVGFSQKIAKGNLDEPLPIHKNNLFGSFVEGFDIMREELKASKKREMEAEIARKELITQLSHDIKTPLAVIKATCEVLDVKLKRNAEVPEITDGDKEELSDAIEKIDVISRKADLVSSIMSNVMHATLDELDHIEVNVKEENSKVVEDLFKNLENYGNLIIENSIPSCLIYLDKLRMEQVIDNVVGNSSKYAGTDIRISFSETGSVTLENGKEARFVRVTIKDNGPGVSEDDLPLICEKYYRGKNSEDQNGYGLGLYLVRLYMTKMLGGMDVYNDNGFVVELLIRKV